MIYLIYLIIAFVIFLRVRKQVYSQSTQIIEYVNLLQYGLLLLCITFPITLFLYIIDVIIIYRSK